MTILESILLGFVQGATEFLPVSSSGHLAIFKYIFGITEAGISFDILLHVGTLIAVFAVYYKDIFELVVALVNMIASVVRNIGRFFKNSFGKSARKEEYEPVVDSMLKRWMLLMIVSIIPVGVLGFILEDWIESISEGLLIPGICLLITGVVLLIADTIPAGNKTARTTSYKDALIIGCAQACAMFPGISRSGSTISAAMLVGQKKQFAVKYSFIMSIPIILGAALKSLMDVVKGETVTEGVNFGVCIVGLVVAAVVGYAAIKLLLRVVKNNKFKYFAFYCFAVGLFAVIGSFCI